MAKYAQCCFETSPNKLYTYEVTSETCLIKEGDFVIVEANPGTYRFPFTIVKVCVLSNRKPSASKGMKLKKIVAAPSCMKDDAADLDEDDII